MGVKFHLEMFGGLRAERALPWTCRLLRRSQGCQSPRPRWPGGCPGRWRASPCPRPPTPAAIRRACTLRREPPQPVTPLQLWHWARRGTSPARAAMRPRHASRRVPPSPAMPQLWQAAHRRTPATAVPLGSWIPELRAATAADARGLERQTVQQRHLKAQLPGAPMREPHAAVHQTLTAALLPPHTHRRRCAGSEQLLAAVARDRRQWLHARCRLLQQLLAAVARDRQQCLHARCRLLQQLLAAVARDRQQWLHAQCRLLQQLLQRQPHWQSVWLTGTAQHPPQQRGALFLPPSLLSLRAWKEHLRC